MGPPKLISSTNQRINESSNHIHSRNYSSKLKDIMSKASGSYNNKMHIRVKVGDITIEVSVPSNKNADPAIIAEIARQAGDAAEKHCQAQSEKGFFNSVKRLFTFKGKNKTEDNKTESQTDEAP